MNDITFRRPLAWKSGSKTDVGTVRKVNEDALIERPDVNLWAVADGMGGHAIGDVASSKIIAALEYLEPTERMSELVSAVEDRLIAVNDQLIECADIMLDEGMMGSTFVGMLVQNEMGVCMWVGDSRLYRLRHNELTQLTRDHSQVEEMLEQGLITPEQAENHPQGNVITRAVGAETPLLVDLEAFHIHTGDTYLLCSDGLYNAVSDESIIQSLGHRDVQKSADELIEKAINNKANDNVSVIVIRGEPGKYRS